VGAGSTRTVLGTAAAFLQPLSASVFLVLFPRKGRTAEAMAF
jgi:hypothetical protein